MAQDQNVPTPPPGFTPVPAAESNPVAPTPPPGFTPVQSEVPIERAGEGLVQGAKDVLAPVAAMLKPPETPMEIVLHNTGGDAGLAAYRAAKQVVGSAQGLVKADAQQFPLAKSDWQKAVQAFHNRDYRGALTSGAEAVGDVAGMAQPTLTPAVANNRQLLEASRPGGNFAGEAARQAVPAVAAVLGTPEVVGEDTLAGTAMRKMNPFRAQKMARTALDEATTSMTSRAGITPGGVPSEIGRDALDSEIAQMTQKVRDTYDLVKQKAGTDMKDLYDEQEKIQDALRDPTNIRNRALLNKDLSQINDRIANGEALARKNGIDARQMVTQADTLRRTQGGLEDFQKEILNKAVEGNDPDPKINIKKALTAAEKLDEPRATGGVKYSTRENTRLEQILGSDGAEKFMDALKAADRRGVKEMAASKIVAGGLGFGLIDYLAHRAIAEPVIRTIEH
jgi:hypothetical protein